jgi:hypothetical protein
MAAPRLLIALLLLATLPAPQLLRASASGCVTWAEADQHRAPTAPQPCRADHSGGDSHPGGVQGCTMSLHCASSLALVGAIFQRCEPTAAVAVHPRATALPLTDSPEPQAPPPRSS